jgi:MFS family permease
MKMYSSPVNVVMLTLLVILIVRGAMPAADFNSYGWRIPFLLSIFLVAISVYIRSRMKESPLFSKLKSEGKTSTAPIKDSFGKARNWRTFFIVLLGAAAGQAVVWYTGQFYVNTWMQSSLKINSVTANTIVAIALALGMPFFVVFGALSDRIGRKKVMMAGNLLAVIFLYPIFLGIQAAAGPITPEVKDAAGKVVTPAVAANPDTVTITLLIFVMLLFVTMVYGPIAAFLVESFPAKIRYTSVSLPYHFGNGYFGGWLPFIATALVAATGNIYAGLWFPIGIALMTFVVGMIFLKETHHVSIHDETEEAYPTPA